MSGFHCQGLSGQYNVTGTLAALEYNILSRLWEFSDASCWTIQHIKENRYAMKEKLNMEGLRRGVASKPTEWRLEWTVRVEGSMVHEGRELPQGREMEELRSLLTHTSDWFLLHRGRHLAP